LARNPGTHLRPTSTLFPYTTRCRSHAAIEAWWRDWLEGREPLIYFKVWQRGGMLINAITESWLRVDLHLPEDGRLGRQAQDGIKDRKSTRLNSSHVKISYAVFCLKK